MEVPELPFIEQVSDTQNCPTVCLCHANQHQLFALHAVSIWDLPLQTMNSLGTKPSSALVLQR